MGKSNTILLQVRDVLMLVVVVEIEHFANRIVLIEDLLRVLVVFGITIIEAESEDLLQIVSVF